MAACANHALWKEALKKEMRISELHPTNIQPKVLRIQGTCDKVSLHIYPQNECLHPVTEKKQIVHGVCQEDKIRHPFVCHMVPSAAGDTLAYVPIKTVPENFGIEPVSISETNYKHSHQQNNQKQNFELFLHPCKPNSSCKHVSNTMHSPSPLICMPLVTSTSNPILPSSDITPMITMKRKEKLVYPLPLQTQSDKTLPLVTCMSHPHTFPLLQEKESRMFNILTRPICQQPHYSGPPNLLSMIIK
ncbi:uncharacterized protein LOC118199975 [Stegodyphus dumicola]|uniref:uncharacterized protein LOC118199975 n=1 Tax=Stegodyphus dumicola TaxID=202533 RepID=UPI0015AC5235|nr:uncharacterized protein LOC118199975 [Stegodyphus dumicola]